MSNCPLRASFPAVESSLNVVLPVYKRDLPEQLPDGLLLELWRVEQGGLRIRGGEADDDADQQHRAQDHEKAPVLTAKLQT